MKEMSKDEEMRLREVARQIRNQKAREWRAKNKDKVKEYNDRRWLSLARKAIQEEEQQKK